MKVLFLSPGLFDKGGIARYGRYQLRAMKRMFGARSVRALSLLGPAPGDLEDPIEVSWAGSPRPSPFSRAAMVVAAISVAKKWKPNVVLSGHVNLGPLGTWAAKLSGGKLVTAIYGREVWSGLSPFRASALRKADQVISDCHHTAEAAVKLGLRDRKPEVVWDCVDLDRYCPGEPAAEALMTYGLERTKRFRVLFLGRVAAVARYKGTDRLLRVLATLPAGDFEGVVAGKGDDLPFLNDLAERLGIHDRISFPGPIHERHMADVYRSADAFYLVSEAGPGKGEGLPLTPIEAMACGTPTLVGNQDGSREVLDGSGGGWTGSPGDLDGQASYLRALRSDGRLLVSERGAARRRAESVFGFDGFATATSRILRETVVG